MRRLALITALTLLGIAAWQGVAAQGDPPPEIRPSWRTPAGDPDRGRELAVACLQCHGDNPAITEPVAPRLNRQRSSALFFALLDYREGRRTDPTMTGMAAGLSDQDARDLAAALAGEMLDRPPTALIDHPAYAQVARECLWCHGETGIGEFEGMPVLTGQDAAYLARALAGYRDGSRTNPIMTGIAATLTDEQIAQLADYYAGHAWLERNQ